MPIHFAFLHQNVSIGVCQFSSTSFKASPRATTCCCVHSTSSTNLPESCVSRRSFLLAVTAATASATIFTHAGSRSYANADELYQVHKPRYIPQGRPPPTMSPPMMDPSIPTQEVQPTLSAAAGTVGAPLRIQDIELGRGDKVVERGTLVLAKWTILLADGSVIEDTPAAQLFRVGVGQTYPGIDAALIGMRQEGSTRRITGPATSFFSDITTGERALAPSDATVFAVVRVLKCNPFGVHE